MSGYYTDTTARAVCCWDDCTVAALTGIGPLCGRHLIKAWRIAERHIEWLLDTPADPLPTPTVQTCPDQTRSLVYYFRGMRGIKIGRTVDLPARMKTLMVADEDVLACEPGGAPKETFRHRQFNALRYPRTEFFRESEDLIEHIAMIRRTFGDPIRLGDSLIKYRGALLDETPIKR